MEGKIAAKYQAIGRTLNERQRRLWAATEAQSIGYGGVSTVWRATGISRRAIHVGLKELDARTERDDEAVTSIRQSGGGRKSLTESQPGLLGALAALVEPTARGTPNASLQWSCKSTRYLAGELQGQGFEIERQKVSDLLDELGYSLQANRKVKEGAQHPDRDAQFKHIATQIANFGETQQPAISVDTKKKELVGDFKNNGREWHRHHQPTAVRVHDFQDKRLGKAIPYGVYDIAANEGWVSVGIDHDTAQFAVASIHSWWRRMGQRRYTHADALLITADGGGSNGSRSRLWKVSLQHLANQLRFPICVCHYPPDTSKWNRIEHRLFSYIAINWRAHPLISIEVILELIRNTHTDTGLHVKAALDHCSYPIGIKVSQLDFDAVNIELTPFHGDWNYIISPS